MIKLEIDQNVVKQLAKEVATQALEEFATQAMELMKKEIQAQQHDLPIVLTRAETQEILRCRSTKMSELMNRPDFPVNRECGGVKIPSHLLLKWIEKNTRWVEQNTDYFDKVI